MKSTEDDKEIQNQLGVYDRVSFLQKFKERIQEIKDLPTVDSKIKVNISSKQNTLGGKLQMLAQQRGENFRTESSENALQNTLYDSKKESAKSKAQLNMFSVRRGPCKACASNDLKCDQYRACFNIESFRGVEIFQCLNCGCAMNSHQILHNEHTFSNLICQQVNRRYVNEFHLHFKASATIFYVDRKEALEFKIDVESLVSSMNEGGFNVLSFYEMDIAQLQRSWIEKYLYSKQAKNLQNEFQRYQQYLETFLDLIYQYGVENTFNLRDSIRNPEDIAILDFYLKRLEKVNQKLSNVYQMDKIALIFLITGNSQNLHSDFKKFIYAAKSKLPTDLQYSYSSKSPIKALRDILIFFPSFFKLNITSFLITQQFDEIHKDKRQINDTFMDMLDFNNISILKQDFNQFGVRNFSEAFSFIPNPDKFLKLVQVEGLGTILKIGCKIGPSNLTIMSNNLPNYYRISSQKQNQDLCDKLSPELFINQRILVIYRPIVVKSNLEILMGSIWQLNDFTQIESAQYKLSVEDAKMLATLENIHPNNLNNYITMMTEGFCHIVLYARPGAFQNAKIITDGCYSGLKVRQSKKLQELSITHKMKSGKEYVEKLSMRFHNFFEQFTQQNIFSCIKDLFDLEELVLQENQSNYNKNIFQNDDQVFLAPTSDTSQSNLTSQLRQQIIKDLPKENFNFYVYSTVDELTTEQLTSIFLPECSQNEVIYVIIKPTIEQYQDKYYKNVKNLIERMKFVIFDQKQIQLDPIQASDMINFICPFKLDAQIQSQLTAFYSQNTLTILSLMKPAGFRELRNFQSNFNLNIPTYGVPQLINELHPFLVPCLNIHAIRFVSKLFNQNLAKFDGDLFKKQSLRESIEYLLKYMLSYCFGSQMKSDYELLNQECSLSHINYRVKSFGHGEFEIRIRNSLKSRSKYQVTYLEILYDYELLSWYYAKVNKAFPQRCPLSYQYRILYPERIEAGEVDQVFDCQEFVGRNFLLEIYRQIFEFGNNVFEKLKMQQLQHIDTQNERQQLVKKQDIRSFEEQMNKVAHYMERRGKMLSYFWGVKLSKFVKEIEIIQCDEEFSNGYGEILRKKNGYECKYKLKTTDYEHISEVEKRHYKSVVINILQYIQERVETDPGFYDDINQLKASSFDFQNSQMMFSQFDTKRKNESVLEKCINKFMNAIFPNNQCSDLFRYALDTLKLQPQDLQLDQLRIQNDREQIRVSGNEGRTQFDWNHEIRESKRRMESEINNEQISNKQPYSNYVLSHCLPHISSKFQLIGDVMYLLYVELKLLKFYDKFIDLSILEEDIVFSSTIKNTKKYEPKSQAMHSSIRNIPQRTFNDWFVDNYQVDKIQIIDQLIKGFEEGYFLEEQITIDIQRINKKYEHNRSKEAKDKYRMPEIKRMFLFLKCLNELDRYIKDHKDTKERMAELAKPSAQLQKFYNEKNVGFEEAQADDDLRYKEIEDLKQEKNKFEEYIKTIFLFISSDQFQKSFYFDSEYTELRFNQAKLKEQKFDIDYFTTYMQNNLGKIDEEEREEYIAEQMEAFFTNKKEMAVQKEFIETKRYFQPLEMGNNKQEWGKLDQETIDAKIVDIDQQWKQKAVEHLDNYADAPYMNDMHKDDIQKKWIDGITDTALGRFVDTRPDNKKTGIYVDTVKTIEKNLDEKIDKVIRKFMEDKMNNFNKK